MSGTVVVPLNASWQNRQDALNYWQPIESIGTVAAAGIAAWAAFQSRSSTQQANAAATKLTAIESQRRHNELCPRLRMTCEPFNPGSDTLRLRVMLAGPHGLDRLDRLTVTIRNDHLRRGEGSYQEHMDSPTQEQIRAHIWGPYRFTPGTGPDEAQADITGRVTVYDSALPLGEELPFQLEHTRPGHWMTGMTQSDWLRQRGTVIRVAFNAEHTEHGTWTLPCEIDTLSLPVTVYVPQAPSGAR